MILLLHPKHRSSGPQGPGRLAGWVARFRRAFQPALATSRERWMRRGVFALMFVTLCLGDRGLFKLVGLLRDRASLVAEIQALDARQTSLEADLKRYRYDRSTIERVAREQLDLVLPGETVYKFPSQPGR